MEEKAAIEEMLALLSFQEGSHIADGAIGCELEATHPVRPRQVIVPKLHGRKAVAQFEVRFWAASPEDAGTLHKASHRSHYTDGRVPGARVERKGSA